jgi:hypothetical protein
MTSGSIEVSTTQSADATNEKVVVGMMLPRDGVKISPILKL